MPKKPKPKPRVVWLTTNPNTQWFLQAVFHTRADAEEFRKRYGYGRGRVVKAVIQENTDARTD